MTQLEQHGPLEPLDEIDDAQLICRTDTALGHGIFEDIRDIVYVDAAQLDMKTSRGLAAQVRDINSTLVAADKRYVLVGPGRWGSSDPTLGVPVTWSDIHGACVIVETPIGTRRVEPSQGTHFFRNITAARVGYLTVTDTDDSWLNRPWLDAAASEGAVRHIALDTPITVRIDGRNRHAIVRKPEA